ncbi:MAG: hypothetical protein AAF384_14540 [Pseudomonadota bacterium]
MYVVHVMYPNPADATQEFDMRHYLEVHMPMGIGYLHREFGVRPCRVEVCGGTYGADRTNASADYNCFGSVYFETKQEADTFIELFEMERPRGVLAADWPKYTPADPIAVLGEIKVLDIDETLEKGKAVIEIAEREYDAR